MLQTDRGTTNPKPAHRALQPVAAVVGAGQRRELALRLCGRHVARQRQALRACDCIVCLHRHEVGQLEAQGLWSSESSKAQMQFWKTAWCRTVAGKHTAEGNPPASSCTVTRRRSCQCD